MDLDRVVDAVGRRPLGSVRLGCVQLAAMVEPGHFLSVHRGEYPVIITVPHGGRHAPECYPERPHGVFCDDDFTAELSRELQDAMTRAGAKCGKITRPYRVRTRLKRALCEMNRAGPETHNSAEVMPVYDLYHATIEDFVRECIERHGFALILDVHGQSHRPCLELGYGITTEQMNAADADGDASIDAMPSGECTIAAAPAIQRLKGSPNCHKVSDLVRGPPSLGSLLARRNGRRAIPSAAERTIDLAESKHYFWGAYTIRRYSREHPHNVIAIQLESPLGWREDARERAAYADDLAHAILEFVEHSILGHVL